MTTETPRAAQGLSVLVAEDNAMNQRVATAMLERLGCETEVAENGREALAILRARRFDVVLLDIQMPELDGLATAAAIVAEWPDRGARPRLVGMTANGLPGDRARCLSAGMDDYLPKPLELTELVRVLATPAAGEAHAAPGIAREAAQEPRRSHASPSGEGLLDRVTIQRLRALSESEGGGLLPDLVDIFAEETPRQLAKARDARDAGDLPRLAVIAHRIRGSCSSLGIIRMTAIATDLEIAATEGRAHDVPRLLDTLTEELPRARAALLRLTGRDDPTAA